MEMYTRGWGRRRGGNGGVAGDVHAKVGVGGGGGGKGGLVDMYMLGIYTNTVICSIRHIYRHGDMFYQAYIPREGYILGYVLSDIYTERGICSVRHIYQHRDMFHQAYISTQGYAPSGYIPTQGYAPSGIRHSYSRIYILVATT